MGLFTKFDDKNENIIDYKILTDISGFEDYFGDMDFKIAGSTNGITAIQVDFKIPGVPFSIIKEVIEKSIGMNHKKLLFLFDKFLNILLIKKTQEYL